MSDKPSIDSIFCSAIDIESPDERQALVEQACGEDADLKQQVERLLEAHFHGRSILDAPVQPVATACEPLRETVGTVIGPYKLLEQIGEGGMGTVWMAEQKEPINRRVALKVIKAGMDSRQVLARFDAERQALALMDHPNIARVLDAGTTDGHRPFFVMELVKGTPIIKYCDEKRLSVRERLELFGDVCRAVQHAHQKGIIHRDLKPSNILIAPFDGRPVVKVIDFGVAKAIGQRLTEATLFTAFGAVVGTPEYMSPEQAETNNQDIDTRSDIYSLGVLLYELLTGSTPLTRRRVKEAALLEVLRVIREEEPPRPSTRLSSTEELPSIAARRQMEPRKLTALLQGELDWIVMKALEKDRSRRYETANGFARDIQRYLADEPVEACPPSAAYKLRKFIRKNRRALATAGAFIVLLVAGAVVSTWQAIRAIQAEAAANANAQRAHEEANAKAVALAAEQKARQDESIARQQAFTALRSLATDAYGDAVMKLLTDLDPLRQQEDFPKLIAQVVVLAQARYYIRRSQWDKAAAEYAKADFWSRPVGDDAFTYACLLLIRQDTEGYKRFCLGICQRTAQPEGPEAYVLARSCAMARNSPVDPARIVKWAHQAVASNSPWDFHVLGLAQYCAGQYDQALQSFTKANVKAWNYADLNWFGLTLVHHRLGHPDKARACLAKSIGWLERISPPTPERPAKLLPQDWLEAQVLRREAEEMLKIKHGP